MAGRRDNAPQITQAWSKNAVTCCQHTGYTVEHGDLESLHKRELSDANPLFEGQNAVITAQDRQKVELWPTKRSLLADPGGVGGKTRLTNKVLPPPSHTPNLQKTTLPCQPALCPVPESDAFEYMLDVAYLVLIQDGAYFCRKGTE